MEYLLDTNICIYIIKKRPIHVFDKFKSLPIGSIGISTITLAELQFGIMKSSDPEKNQEALDKFLTPLEIIDFDFRFRKKRDTYRTAGYFDCCSCQKP